MAHLVTGYAGVEHIKSEDQGSFNAAFFGEGQFVMEIGNQFEASITSNSNIRILDGDLLMYGRHVRINPNTYEDLTIETGIAGTNRIDLIVMTYEKNAASGVESARLEVIKGTATANPMVPGYVNGNILEGEVKNQMPLYKVSIQGVVLKSVEPMFTTCPTFRALAERYAQQFEQDCSTHLDSLNILDTTEEIEANTRPNQMTGALAAKEMLSKAKTAVYIKSFDPATGTLELSTFER